MSKNWQAEKRRDGYYRKAKAENYRSRAAYKLFQIDGKFKILRKGHTVIDLGAAPGGWSQAAQERVGDEGLVIGVDLQPIKPLPGENAVFTRGDFTKEDTVARLLQVMAQHGKKKADAVISDMSPNLTGNYTMDHARSIHLCELALEFCNAALRPGGSFVVKVFEGEMFKQFFDNMKSRFGYVKAHSPRASRSSSSEIYVIGKRFKGPARAVSPGGSKGS